MQAFGTQHDTGNVVVDTVLTTKARYCASNQITLTAVADGTVVDHISAMDPGQPARQCAGQRDRERRAADQPGGTADQGGDLRPGGFAMLRFENYFDGVVNYTDGQIVTRKTDDPHRHGLGLKSIRHIAAKYGGEATVEVEQNWFTLSVLLPRP